MTRHVDPLQGLDPAAVQRDGASWRALLGAAKALGGEYDPQGLYGLLRGLRACGTALEPSSRGWRLDPPPDMPRDTMRDAIGDHAQLLAALLRASGDVRRLRHAPRLDVTPTAAPLPDALEVQHAFEPA